MHSNTTKPPAWCYTALLTSFKSHPTLGLTLRVCSLACWNPELSYTQSLLPSRHSARSILWFSRERLFPSFSFFDLWYLTLGLHTDAVERMIQVTCLGSATAASLFSNLKTPSNFRHQLTIFELYCEESDPLPRPLSKILIEPSHLTNVKALFTLLWSQLCKRKPVPNY